MIVKYLNNDGEYSIVKIRLHKNSNSIDFDVYFARLPIKGNKGMDVTINWSNLLDDNRGIFYTDANAFKVIKHDTKEKKSYQ
jgi:hypothetical protein